jgi:hypothetical protein
MSRHKLNLILLCLLTGGLAITASSSQVVTNPTPAVAATMALSPATDNQGCFVWNVAGKVKPSYRGFGAAVNLLCESYDSIGAGGLVFPNTCDGPCAAIVDACGNFNFDIHVCGASPQIDNNYFCTFVVHVDGAATPNACNGKSSLPDALPEDPNGTAPCAGGFCPSAP